MRSPLKILPSKADYPRLGVSIFCIAWLIGNMALLIGLNGAGGEVPAAFGFAMASLIWWGGYRLGGTKSLTGTVVAFLAITIWTLGLLGAVVSSFDHYVADPFFWCSTGTLLLLTIAVVVALSKTPDRTKES